jgi:hypothetical protein
MIMISSFLRMALYQTFSVKIPDTYIIPKTRGFTIQLVITVWDCGGSHGNV